MHNLKFFICAVGEKIVGLFRNPRRNVVELSTSEFLDVYNRSSSPWFCFVVRNYIHESYWSLNNNVVHRAFRDAYPEVFKEWVTELDGTVYSWLNVSNETVRAFIKKSERLYGTSFRIELLKMLISEYGDRKLCFKIRSGK